MKVYTNRSLEIGGVKAIQGLTGKHQEWSGDRRSEGKDRCEPLLWVSQVGMGEAG